ncbi:NUDIX hydrolase [Candidatus Aerophobetes bacterium]|uniref:Bis(5'-nucleosyl)-tetraphosphatase [asymmetrical] n=1 Tax=Aerophobetes bacterium TaxID=2030807 RepID=A0A2A4X1P4_UNCAE|nr:MAG: NUDIX hydrolase [Candidatus Aerophobetes bacterium]
MKEDQSFGVIPVRTVQGDYEVLILKHINGDHWGFPKGHANVGETAQATAKRELQEETGLLVESFLEAVDFTQEYTFSQHGSSIHKRVVYFLAQVQGDLVLQQEEILEGKWVRLSQLSSYAKFDNARSLFQSVKNYLEG